MKKPITRKQLKSSRSKSNRWGKKIRQRLQQGGMQNVPWWY